MDRARGWDIQSYIDNKDQFQKVYHKWNIQSQRKLILQGYCSCIELDKKVA